KNGYRTKELQQKINSAREQFHVNKLDPTSLINPKQLAMELSKEIPKNSLLTVGAGHYWGFFNMYTHIRPDTSVFYSSQLGAIGQTLSLAIGIGLEFPDRPQMILDGDGSFLMNIQELATIVRYKMPMVILIWNDFGYGAEAHKLKAQKLEEQQAKWSESPDFVKIAQGFGGD